MTTPRLVAVRLDSPTFGSGPGVIVSYHETVAEYFASVQDRDGARDARMRLWRLDDRYDDVSLPVGSRVVSASLVCGTGKGRLRETT